MRQLAIECASEACSVALFDGGELAAHHHQVLGRGHAERLIPIIAALPDKGKASRILVSRGPGSFTGVRIGLAAARALGIAWNAHVLGYPTLALVAAAAQSRHGETSVSVAMRGGHGEIFQQDFSAAGLPDHALQSLSPQSAAARAAHPLIAGTMAAELLTARGHGDAVETHPDARHVLALSPDLLTADLTPIYGRAPDARPAA